MKWITRERPKVDRLACPWLIRKFIDPDAEFLFVPTDQVMARAADTGAIPFDVPNVEYTHYGTNTTFDYFLEKHGLSDPALATVANIVRGADLDRHDLAPESAGLWAISVGLSHTVTDDYKLLDYGFVMYDALYFWAEHLTRYKHLDGSSFENLLHDVYSRLLSDKASGKAPSWASELKHMIQDHLDAQLNIGLASLSAELGMNPNYLSREFPRYFENKNFGEYIRRARIEKAVSLFGNPDYTLTEIAYMTGFSDQSHFTRVFRQVMGQNPSQYRKQVLQGKIRPNK